MVKISGQFRCRKHIPVLGQGLPYCSAMVGPLRSQWAEPGNVGGGVALPFQGWAALSGEQELAKWRNMDGGEPAVRRRGHGEHRSIIRLLTFIWVIMGDKQTTVIRENITAMSQEMILYVKMRGPLTEPWGTPFLNLSSASGFLPLWLSSAV